MMALETGANRKGEALHGAPLWPAGHLPLKGGDGQLGRRLPFSNVGDWRNPKRQPISPLEGEMVGRPEGGAKDLDLSYCRAQHSAAS
ncbi:hypothetical protein MPLB_770063 [Mesorhizobium sp. ORS 3324]|nr:hypothetical protein MPLB_770063 [Mesorhizobium sp. ORS 3324]